MNKQEVEGRPQKKSDGAHLQQSADLSSPVLAAFKVFQKELDTKHDKHERLVKLSRDITIESKRTIFLLHRVTSVPDVEVVLNEADGKLDGVRQKIGQIAEELKGEDIFQFHRAFTAGIQEYVEAASFQHYIRHRSLISLEQINARLVFMTGDKVSADTLPTGAQVLTFQVMPSDYLLGIADLTGELMRLCISSVGNGDIDTPFQLSQFLRQIHDGFTFIGNTGPYEVSKKLHTLRQSLGKVEDACYTLKVRGSEIPKHMLADVFSSRNAHMDPEEGGMASGTAGSFSRKRLHRRYMREEQCRPQTTTDDQEDEDDVDTCMSECQTDAMSLSPAGRISPMNLLPNDDIPFPSTNCSTLNDASNHCRELMLKPDPVLLHSAQARLATPEDSFNSSFSFIQQSLSTPALDSESPQATKVPHLSHIKPASLDQPESKQSPLITSTSVPGSHEDRTTISLLGGRFWGERVWGSREVDGDFQCPDTEVTSSLSLDSDTASASSVTSGYESATPASDQGWDNLVKKYDRVLQDCLQSNRTHTKIESMMLKLHRLQQKAIIEDDYDAAERFGKKLEELCRERGSLKLGLPSRQPSVALFLERLRQVVQSALQRTDTCKHRSSAELDAGERSDSSRRDRLIQEKRAVEDETKELQQRLTELKDRSRCLEQQIQREEQQMEAEELEGSVLRSCTVAQLRDMNQTLQDLVTSENRTQIAVSPPPSMLRLLEQEQALTLSIKEATAKVVMSQKLGSSLRRKVSEVETQLLALHEAKLAAISGNDFSSAKELKAEIKAMYQEQERLEVLAKRLHSLSSGSSQELARMKEQRQQLRQELEQREAQHESKLKENTGKYIELLEDRLHSCSCPGLERIWEADLEACHLFLRGLQLQTSSYSGADFEDYLATAGYPSNQVCTKEEEDSAMLTALGGRWCPEANLQNSEFTKKLEEFLFSMEDINPQDVSSDDEAADLAERCELIGDRLMTLEDDLQTAILNRDQALIESLERKVQEVKATLQNMLALLKEEVKEDSNEDDPVENGIFEEDEEEDQYFSDSWDI
ncbi:disrupted in schizophrenia 1 protein-like isoform X4 [Entelurus aequoreus]|uniref:disrupted in schizophrenia 1 protein-like isoform X4 n=1 Tax=Entelurus aequoreus TaxID=161455 RepID=UPI002B1D24F0|nr:disrupted in schizophrenia 1 protein-like isoform X4 [Entelurus aequoreus]